MDTIIHQISQSSVAQNLLANPMLAIAVVIVAVVLAKVLKLAGKIIKVILILGLAYVIVNFVMSGVI